MVLATVPIIEFISSLRLPTIPFPFFGRQRPLLPSHDNAGISLILLCNDLVTFVVLYVLYF
jgi:hypothetical protein